SLERPDPQPTKARRARVSARGLRGSAREGSKDRSYTETAAGSRSCIDELRHHASRDSLGHAVTGGDGHERPRERWDVDRADLGGEPRESPTERAGQQRERQPCLRCAADTFERRVIGETEQLAEPALIVVAFSEVVVERRVDDRRR